MHVCIYLSMYTLRVLYILVRIVCVCIVLYRILGACFPDTIAVTTKKESLNYGVFFKALALFTASSPSLSLFSLPSFLPWPFPFSNLFLLLPHHTMYIMHDSMSCGCRIGFSPPPPLPRTRFGTA